MLKTLSIPGGWEGDARPDGGYVVLMGPAPGAVLETHFGPIAPPTGPAVRYPRITPTGPVKIAGQTDHIVEWTDGAGWLSRSPGPIAAISAVIYDATGTLHLINRAIQDSAAGFRYVDQVTHQPVIGERTGPTAAVPLHEWTDLGEGWFIGQGPTGGCYLRTPERTWREVFAGDAMFIRAQRDGDAIGVALYERPAPTAHLFWFTLSEARTVFPEHAPTPAEPPTPPPAPAPPVWPPAVTVDRWTLDRLEDGREMAFHDEHDPRYGARVWVEDGSVRASLTNPSGTGLTFAQRPVAAPPSSPSPPPPAPPTAPPAPPVEPPVTRPTFETGLVAFFGEPLPESDVVRMVRDWGVTSVVSGMPRTVADREHLFAQVARHGLRVRWICDTLADLALVPTGGRAQWQNEPTSAAAVYAASVNHALTLAASLGIDLAVGAINNPSPDRLDWLRDVLRLAPAVQTVSFHRYPDGIDTGPRPGFSSLAAEFEAVRAVAGHRTIICTEVGLHLAPHTTGWGWFRKTRRRTQAEQRDFLAGYLAAAQRAGVPEVYVYQHRDGPTDTPINRYGVQDVRGVPKLSAGIFAPYRATPSTPPSEPTHRPPVIFPQTGLSYYAGLGDPDFDWSAFADFCRDHQVGYTRVWAIDAWALGERNAAGGYLPGQYAGYLPCTRRSDGRFDLFTWRADYFARVRMMTDTLNARGLFPLITLWELYAWSSRKAGLPFVPDVNQNLFRNNVNGIRYGDPDDKTFGAPPFDGQGLPDDWFRAFCTRLLTALGGTSFALQIGNEMPEKAMHWRICALLRDLGYTGEIVINRNEDGPGQPFNMEMIGAGGAIYDRHEFHLGTGDEHHTASYLDTEHPAEAAAGRPTTIRALLGLVDPGRIIVSSDGDGGRVVPTQTALAREIRRLGASFERQSILKRNRFYGDGTLRMADLQQEAALLEALRQP